MKIGDCASENRNFYPLTLFLEGSQLIFSSSKQVSVYKIDSTDYLGLSEPNRKSDQIWSPKLLTI